MARTARPKPELVLSTEERSVSERLAKRPKSGQAAAMRARLIINCAKSDANREVGAWLEVSEAIVGKWRRRFVEQRLDGLSDDPRPGGPRTLTDGQVDAVVVRALEEKSEDATHSSTRSMAKETGMSPTTINRIWNAFGLQPHRSGSFTLLTDSHFVEKVRDFVDLCPDSPVRAAVRSVDEKSQIRALNRFPAILAIMPATPRRGSHGNVRHRTTCLFAALDMATGKVIGSMTTRHPASELKRFPIDIDEEVPDDLAVHLVLDQYAIHKTPEITSWLLCHPRLPRHFTPASGSWLNMVERWFGELTTNMVKRGAHTSVAALENDIGEWIAHWNENPRPYVWVRTADQSIASLARSCERVSAAVSWAKEG